MRISDWSSDVCSPDLVHHGILAGQRGPRGGYRLARERRRISVGEIIRIVRQLEGTVDPASEPDGSEIGVKVLRPIWNDIQQQMMARFDGMTIAELCDKAREKDNASTARQVTAFHTLSAHPTDTRRQKPET